MNNLDKKQIHAVLSAKKPSALGQLFTDESLRSFDKPATKDRNYARKFTLLINCNQPEYHLHIFLALT